MIKVTKQLLHLLLALLLLSISLQVMGQSTTGSISGTISDQKEGLLPNATVTARNVETNATRTAQTDSNGRYSFENLAVGPYELTVESAGFARYVQSGITLALNQKAVVDVAMTPAGVKETVTVTENASLLNTTTAEVGVRFDTKRISELPIATNRNVYNIALSAAGVSQLGSGQTAFSSDGRTSISYSANGGRVRSNNFMIDGQDNNDAGVAGAVQPLNNPDLIQEVRLVTNQFTAEYGRNSSSVFNAITKSGTNEFHGSGFWFHNDNKLNARSNLDEAKDKALGVPGKSPFRIENQLGGTIGGPLDFPRFGEGGPSLYHGHDRTFFFFSLQRWWDRQLGSGTTVKGVPTAEGRQILQAQAGSRPQVAALLKFLPVAQAPIGTSANFKIGANTFAVPLGQLTGSTSFAFNDWQTSFRVDHKISNNHSLSGRYLYDDQDITGSGQATPPGLSTQTVARNQSASVSLNSVLSARMVNEFRAAYLRGVGTTGAQDPSSEEIPSIEITQLGLTGFNADASRTAIGLAVNQPQFSYRENYQLQDNLSYTTGSHSLKFGADGRQNRLKQFFFPTIRGRLLYSSLDNFVNDVADVATINKPLTGGQDVYYYNWTDFFAYGQDEWRVRPNFTLTFGLRYESPGQPITDLVAIDKRILAAAGGNPGFAFTPVPKRDKNNFQPRLGFNWNPHTSRQGIIGRLTGGDKLVLRGGYARTNDYSFTNIASNIASSFPFVASVTLAAPVSNAFTILPTIKGATGLNPATLTRTIVGDDFRSPSSDQYSLEVQRELARDVVMRVGYVGTKGNGLFQTIDGNPRLPYSTARVDPTRAIVRLRANAGSSIYHSMQVSLDKRLSRGFSAAVHYTWSSFIDTASEIFNPSTGEVAVSQDSFDRSTDRARSGYDRPHRFTGNFVYELPFYRTQQGFTGHLLGGWQVNSFFTFQSGAPFTVLNGSDPTGALSGIDGLVGQAIRPNLNTNLPLGNMSVEQIVRAGGATLFSPLLSKTGPRGGNAGRNILRADGIGNVDFGLLKNIRTTETQTLQLRADFFNATNTRNFGIPDGRAFSSAGVPNSNFLNQWGTNGGNRRVIVGLRYVF
ncbi:MAG TPA: carboxypeptidase regulatory-like domain-containing protein [Pyrinomonadaceae bacterium]|jgi:hypothetical protein|nr:carboxypeptidase regulatory-like domain-containing protein [Pyrinomonadaceae bacterium]